MDRDCSLDVHLEKSEPTRAGICRVILLFHEEGFDAALENFRAALGVVDFEGPLTLADMGLKIAVSWDAGLELITPYGDGEYAEQMRAHLRARGEGVVDLVFRVPDLESAAMRAASAGYPARGPRIDCLAANPEWKSRFSLAIEAPLSPIAGLAVTLIQLDPQFDGLS